MTTAPTVFHFGSTPGVRAGLQRLFADVRTDLAELKRGDLAVIEAFAPHPALPGGNAFSACTALKERPGASVHMVVAANDPHGRQIARFCLADGVVVFDPKLGLLGAEDLVASGPRRSTQRIDALLAKYGSALSGDDERSQSALQRLLHFEREDNLLTRLQDPETGLFDGPYAAFKLDEEYRRAVRLHLPLALMLLDIGAGSLPGEDGARAALLAEVAAVFLNESRDIDVLARFTATTFLFLLPGTHPDGAAVLARRMLASLTARPFADGVALQPCVGIAAVPAAGIDSRRAMLQVAEACLEAARGGGGDGRLVTSWE